MRCWWDHCSQLINQNIELVPSLLFAQVSRFSFCVIFFSKEIHHDEPFPATTPWLGQPLHLKIKLLISVYLTRSCKHYCLFMKTEIDIFLYFINIKLRWILPNIKLCDQFDEKMRNKFNLSTYSKHLWLQATKLC